MQQRRRICLCPAVRSHPFRIILWEQKKEKDNRLQVLGSAINLEGYLGQGNLHQKSCPTLWRNDLTMLEGVKVFQ